MPFGTAPENLDTFYELAEAINQDKNFASTMTNALANKQDLNSALSSISNLAINSDTMIFSTAPNTYDVTTLTNFARTLLDDENAEIARQTLNALGKNEKAVNATTSDFAIKSQQDAEGNIITQKYLPKISTVALKIPADSWIDDGDKPFNLYRDFEISGLTAADVVNVNISPNHQGLCVDCGLCPTCEIFDGKIRIRAKEIPTAEISAEFYILKGAAQGKEKSFGSVNCSTSQRVIIYKVPEQFGTLTFNQKIQTPIWDDYDPTKFLMTGEISGINADIYTVTFTPIGNCTWADDTRTPKSQTWKINRAVIFKIPSQKNILTFTGTPQTPTLENYNPEEIILSGDFENKTDAGAYIAYATPTSNFMFSDNSTDAKFFLWTINKAAPIIELDKNYLSLENILMSDTVKINRLGDGKISATSSDENVVTVENFDSEVKVSAIATGNSTITINVAESKNYLAASINLPVESFVIKPLKQCTPAEIVSAIQSGKAQNAWDVGDLIAPITLNGKIGDALTLENWQIRAKLIGFNHNSEFESGGNFSAHFIFETALIDENYNFASANGTKYFQHNTFDATNLGGWSSSNLRVICENIFDALPEDWKNIISPCTKYTFNFENVTATVDKIFLLSEYEVFGRHSYANSSEQNFQAQYEFFKNGNLKIFYSDEKAVHWWLRTPQNSNETSFCRVNSEGALNTYNARFSQGVVPAFMI